MRDLIQAVDSPQEITCAAQHLREISQQKEVPLQVILDTFDQWAAALDDQEPHEVPGVRFSAFGFGAATWSPFCSAS